MPKLFKDQTFQAGTPSDRYPPQITTTAFTTPAYSASYERDERGLFARIWSGFCFVCGTFLGFHGRISRLDYWLIGTAYSLTAFIGYFAFATAAGSWNFTVLTSHTQDPVFQVQFFVFSFFMIMLRLSLEARRFQDRGLSGYWYFGYLVPFLNLYLLVTNSLKAGTPGPNQYDL